MTAKLKLITKTHRPMVVDIYESWRAEIAERNWDSVHVAADKREAVDIPETRKGWRR